MSRETTVVQSIPNCDIHKQATPPTYVPAVADGKTTLGPWAFMCQDCFDRLGVGLGLGRGQRLVLDPAVLRR